MQQVSKASRNQQCQNFRSKLLRLTLLSLMGFITMAAIANRRGEAMAEPSVSVASRNSWQGGSFPVENFQTYTSSFGYRRSATGGGGWEFHRGLDLAAPDGSYIRNWWTGQVIEVSDNTSCGTSVKIQSGEWTHVYCHMKGHVGTDEGRRYLIDRTGGILLWVGQQVPSGARIGRVGMTGRTTGPHLHWGIKYTNQYVDPALVLRAMYSQQVSSGSGVNYAQSRD